MSKIISFALGLLFASSVAQISEAAEIKPAPLVLTRINETFYQATAALVVELLTGMGHSVTVVDGSHTSAYKAIKEGTADPCVGFWLPTDMRKRG
jgi:glycine betaine/proline transport system substrate-binding protein